LEDHGARVPDQDCLEYGRIADIGNRNDFTKRVFQSTGWYSVRCPDIHFSRESTLPYPGRQGGNARYGKDLSLKWTTRIGIDDYR
jgi:hypothetical protein